MNRSGILFGVAFALLGLWALDTSTWLATGLFVLAALYVATAFSPRMHAFLRGPVHRHRDADADVDAATSDEERRVRC